MKKQFNQEVGMAVTVLIKRRAYQERIDALTDAETKFEIYEH